MQNFIQALEQKIHSFSQYHHLEIQINSSLFSLKKGSVSQFIQEIRQTGSLLSSQTDGAYADFYAQKLVRQFDLLNRTIQQQKSPQNKVSSFRSNYRFPKNIHNLSPERRLQEYQKALRLLNEKLTWLTTQAQSCDEAQRAVYIAQIHETEYRKMKCLKAIDELDSLKR